jgi:restriction system protein
MIATRFLIISYGRWLGACRRLTSARLGHSNPDPIWWHPTAAAQFLEVEPRGFLETVLRLAALAVLLIVIIGIARVAAEGVAERRRKRRLAATRDILALTPSEFEGYVAYLLEETGYRVEQTGGSGDRGIDLLAKRDGLTYVVQCKRYEQTIGPGTVREMIGAMTNAGVPRGFLITTSGFTAGARQEARRAPYKLDLVDGTRLVRWARAHGLPAEVMAGPSRHDASATVRQR